VHAWEARRERTLFQATGNDKIASSEVTQQGNKPTTEQGAQLEPDRRQRTQGLSAVCLLAASQFQNEAVPGSPL